MRKPDLTGAYWVVDTLPPERVSVAPDSWIDQAQLARVIAARTLRPFAPLAIEEPKSC